MKKVIISIAVTLLGSLAILAIVIGSAELPEDIRYAFDRQVRNSISLRNSTDLRFNSYYIAGVDSTRIFLANTESPFTLLEYSAAELTKVRTIRLRLSPEKQLFKNSIRVSVYDSTVFITDGKSPVVYRGILLAKGNDCVLKRFRFDGLYFFNAVPVSSQSVLLQSVSKAPYSNILCKESDADSSYSIAEDILEPQFDSLFCTAGILQYNKFLNQVVFVYSHRNKYMLLDTSLCVLGKANTIDTFSIARIRSINVESLKVRQLIAPESHVNKYAFTSGDDLFIVSGFYTGQDDMAVAARSSIIDVYSLNARKYSYSFYVPDHEGWKASSFAAGNGVLYTIHDHYLRAFLFVKPLSRYP